MMDFTWYGGALSGCGATFIGMAPEKWIVGALFLVVGLGLSVEGELRKARAQ